MEIVMRPGWNARAPSSTPLYTTWERRDTFTVHHTAGTTGQSVRSIQDFCMDDKGHSDIDYNALVRDDGTIYEGRIGIWLVIASHSLNHNTHSLGVSWIGNSANTRPSVAALRSIRWLYDEACRRRRAAGYGPLAIVPHSAQRETACPGTFLTPWVKAGMPATPAEGLIMLCRQGDTGEAVKTMQLMVQLAGGDIGASGADGEYGPRTAAGLASVIGGDGTVYGPDQYILLHRKAFGGIAGPKGDPGTPGRTATKFEVTAVAYE